MNDNKKIERIRGTEDLYEQEAYSFLKIKEQLFKLSYLYGYKYFRTPIFENKNLFIRSSGDTTDIVKKEFYDFIDKGGREIALRPEGTASIIRAVNEAKLTNKFHLPLKYFYCGPMFRYERPQSGRNREFYQFGVECIGTKSYLDDVEIICFAINIIQQLNITDYTLTINNIGGQAARLKWIEELKKYFKKYENQLTLDSIERIKTNPLRILDDKIDSKKDFVKNAPKIEPYLSKDEINYFEKIKNALNSSNIKYVVDYSLVRGLDYYTNFVFEINTNDKKLKGQPTLLAGGRYNNLVSELGGDDLSCVGFGCGLERLAIVSPNETHKQHLDILITCLDESCQKQGMKLLTHLRNNNISALINFNSLKLPNQFNTAKDYNVNFIGILGPKELANNQITIKNQTNHQEKTININELIDEIRKYE